MAYGDERSGKSAQSSTPGLKDGTASQSVPLRASATSPSLKGAVRFDGEGVLDASTFVAV